MTFRLTLLCLTVVSDMKLGRNLARTFIDYYKLAQVISQKPSSSIVPKPLAYRMRDRNIPDRSNSEPQYDDK